APGSPRVLTAGQPLGGGCRSRADGSKSCCRGSGGIPPWGWRGRGTRPQQARDGGTNHRPPSDAHLVCILRNVTPARTGSGQRTAPVFTSAPSDIAFPPETDTLPPFPGYAALPRSEYYGGSAPPAPSAGVAPIHPGLPGQKTGVERTRMVPTFTVIRSTG